VANNGPSAIQNQGHFSGNVQSLGVWLESIGMLDNKKSIGMLDNKKSIGMLDNKKSIGMLDNKKYELLLKMSGGSHVESPDFKTPRSKVLVSSSENQIVERLIRCCQVAVTVTMRQTAFSVCLNMTKYVVLFLSATNASHIHRHEFP
jgi:hypothetical protein